MIFADGGEEGFIGQMVEESEGFQTRCKYVVAYIHAFHPPQLIILMRWYTSMLGKMSSVATIIDNLRKRSVRLPSSYHSVDTFEISFFFS